MLSLEAVIELLNLCVGEADVVASLDLIGVHLELIKKL